MQPTFLQRANAIRHRKPAPGPSAAHFLRALCRKVEFFHSTPVCIYAVGDGKTFIEGFKHGDTIISRNNVVYAHMELASTIAELNRVMVEYRALKYAAGWAASDLIEARARRDSLSAELSMLEDALAFLDALEAEGRVPTVWDDSTESGSRGEMINSAPFVLVLDILEGHGSTTSARTCIEWLNARNAHLAKPLPPLPPHVPLPMYRYC